MQIRKDNDPLAQYGTPSRPISPPATLSTPLKKPTTTGNEPGEIDSQSVEQRAGRETPPQQQRSAASPSQFPPELIDHIVDHLHDDKESLIRCSLTSRVFSHATSYHLFRTVRIPSVQRCVRFQEFVSPSSHPLSSTSNPPPSPPPAPHTTHHQITQAHARFTHLHPNPDLIGTQSHARPTCMSICDVSATWDISKFVRKIEFQYPPTSIVEYVSEAVKLVRMLPRIREVAFVWWIGSTGVEEIARAFAPISHNPSHSLNQTPSSTSTSALSETRMGPASASDPLKVHLDMVDFESVHTFLDFLESFGGRLRELSLLNVGFGGDDGKGRGDFRGRRLPGIESVCLGYEAVVKPKVPGLDGPTMGNADGLFGAPDVCNILESIAPNVSELQLFRDAEEAKDVYMYVSPGARTARTLRLPMFRKLKSVTMCVPGSRWSDLIYEIAAWFARNRSHGGIADPTCQDGRASPQSSVTPSLPSSNPATQADRWKDRKRTKVRFVYPVGKSDVDWRKLESAVLGEDLEGLDGRDGNGNDPVDMLMRIDNRGAGGSCSARFMAGSLLVEVGSGSAVLREVRGELGRLDELGLLQVSCW